jgi:hypothetical protein
MDCEDFGDMDYCIPIPGIDDIPTINLKGGILHMER